MPLAVKRLMTSPLTVQLAAVIVNPLIPAPALAPFNSMIGVPAKPGCVVPSITNGLVIVGKAEVGVMVKGPPPGMLKTMASAAIVTLASVIACRKDPAPLLLVLVTMSDNSSSRIVTVATV